MKTALAFAALALGACSIDSGIYAVNVWPLPDGRIAVERCHAKSAGMTGVNYQDDCTVEVHGARDPLPRRIRRAIEAPPRDERPAE